MELPTDADGVVEKSISQPRLGNRLERVSPMLSLELFSGNKVSGYVDGRYARRLKGD